MKQLYIYRIEYVYLHVLVVVLICFRYYVPAVFMHGIIAAAASAAAAASTSTAAGTTLEIGGGVDARRQLEERPTKRGTGRKNKKYNNRNQVYVEIDGPT